MPRYKIRNVPYALDCGPVSDTTYVSVANGSSQVWNGTDSLTVFMRFKPRRISSARQIFAIPATAGNNRRYITQLPTGRIEFTLGASAAVFDIASYRIESWQSIAMVVDANTSQFRAYLNGSLVKDWTAYTPGTGTASSVTLGGNLAALTHGTAKISGIRIWNRVLTSDEVTSVEFDNNISQTNLRGEWLLNEGSGTTATDTSGNANNGTITNPSWTTNTPFKHRTAGSNRIKLRNMGSALSFNGTSSIVVRNAQTAYNLGAFSIGFWIKGDPQAAYNALFAEGNSAASNQVFGIRTATVAGRRELTYFVRDDANTIRTETPTLKEVLDGKPHYVLFSDNNGSVSIYIDGVLDRSFSYTRGTLTLDRTALGGLQRSAPAIWSKAIVDELRVWNTALDATQAAALYYNATVPTGVVLEWLLDENTGTTATDTSGAGGNGVITAPTWVTNKLLGVRPATSNRSNL